MLDLGKYKISMNMCIVLLYSHRWSEAFTRILEQIDQFVKVHGTLVSSGDDVFYLECKTRQSSAMPRPCFRVTELFWDPEFE